MKSKRTAQSGFSAIEAVLILSLMGVATLGLAHGVVAGQRGSTHMDVDSRAFDHAQMLMSRLNAIPFGTGAEGAGDPLQLANLLVVENNLFGTPFAAVGALQGTPVAQYFTGSNARLTQVAMVSPIRWQYVQDGRTYFGQDGVWEIIVDRDLNGDGDLTDPLEVATATSRDLYRVEIRFDGRRLLRTVRSRNPSE